MIKKLYVSLHGETVNNMTLIFMIWKGYSRRLWFHEKKCPVKATETITEQIQSNLEKLNYDK